MAGAPTTHATRSVSIAAGSAEPQGWRGNVFAVVSLSFCRRPFARPRAAWLGQDLIGDIMNIKPQLASSFFVLAVL